MSLFVDTSVWSLALRRDVPGEAPQVERLATAIKQGEQIVTTGIVLQELLQGFRGAQSQIRIIEQFAALPSISPDRRDHIEAAELHGACRRKGLQLGTVDALLAQLCIRRHLTMLTTDRDFDGISQHSTLEIWAPDSPGRQ